ncbi:MAG: M23 family metallopeptidase [Ignavibacteriae bacterium]|nr:M23 family metallopeptidase [Ignavibacteriota bacterium]
MEKNRFTVILVPESESGKTRTFSIAKWAAAGVLLLTFLAIIAFSFGVIVFTPAGRLFPISNPALEKQYGKQIIEIQEQVQSLLQQMTALRWYNLQLRKALGEDISARDSMFAEASQGDTSIANLEPIKLWENMDTDRMQPPMETTKRETESGVHQLPFLKQEVKLPLTMPTDGYLTRGFDAQQFHLGIDLAGKPNSSIVAAADGRVIFSGWTYDDGFMMMIAHSQGYVTVYKHNQVLLKTVGTNVKRGELIALLGNTGKTSSGPHLHFEVWNNGIAYNPQDFLLTTL